MPAVILRALYETEIGFQFRTTGADFTMQPKRRKRARNERRRGPRYWIVAIGAMGVLIAYCPTKSHNVVLAKARIDTPVQTQQQITFNIPTGTPESVLVAFQKSSGLQVEI